MKIRLLSFALTVALVMPAAFAQQAQSAAPVAQPARHPLLWKVSDADNSVYLLGSFHLLKADDYPLPKEVDAAFDDAKSLLFEVDPREMTAPETAAIVQKYAGYDSADKNLSAVLPKPTLDKLGNLLSMTGGSVQQLQQSEPWMVSLSLVLGITNALGFKPELGLDRNLMERAATAGKPASGLETIEDQMKSMDAAPYAEQAQGLDEFLDDPRKAVKQLQDMHAWWRAGDVAKLDSEMRVEMAQKTPQSYKLLDVDRNDAWLPKIEKRLTESKKDNTLVVVGSLHLLGEDGLVEKLRAKGYTVERICEGCEAPAAN